MFKNLKINNKLKTLSLFSIIIIILLSTTNIYLSYKNVTVIKDIYQNNIKALSEMQKIDSKLRDLKYKLAEILLDSVEYDQALDHLTNTKKEIITSWQAMEFEKQIDQISQPEEKTIMLQVIKNWNETLQAIDNVEKAYKGKK